MVDYFPKQNDIWQGNHNEYLSNGEDERCGYGFRATARTLLDEGLGYTRLDRAAVSALAK